MTFRVSTEQKPAGAAGHKVYVLEDSEGARVEVCPELGFNCFRWRAVVNGQPMEMLYSTPTFLEGDRPTRSGIPVLFPFPNRIRDGRFSWAGKEYHLPGNDSTDKNAIHGFACRRAWRVVDQGAAAASAWVTGEFHLSKDDPASQPLWPADPCIRLTCRLGAGSLRLEAVVDNPDRVELPFGLGYHPYFKLPGPAAADALVQAPAASFWELQDSLPTGIRLSVDPKRDLRTPRRYGDLALDDVLTGLEGVAGQTGLRQAQFIDELFGRAIDENGVLGDVLIDATSVLEDVAGRIRLTQCGRVADGGGQVRLELSVSRDFRELVAFTPVHRQAVCLEPYTCTTDAINLQQRGVDAGLLVLPPGGWWAGVVELSI